MYVFAPRHRTSTDGGDQRGRDVQVDISRRLIGFFYVEFVSKSVGEPVASPHQAGYHPAGGQNEAPNNCGEYFRAWDIRIAATSMSLLARRQVRSCFEKNGRRIARGLVYVLVQGAFGEVSLPLVFSCLHVYEHTYYEGVQTRCRCLLGARMLLAPYYTHERPSLTPNSSTQLCRIHTTLCLRAPLDVCTSI